MFTDSIDQPMTAARHRRRLRELMEPRIGERTIGKALTGIIVVSAAGVAAIIGAAIFAAWSYSAWSLLAAPFGVWAWLFVMVRVFEYFLYMDATEKTSARGGFASMS